MRKFKILITSYNNEDWTETCLNSVKIQTYGNFEVIFFDDCSQDKTYQIASEIVGEDKRFKLNKLGERKTKSWIFSNLVDKEVDNNDIVLFLDGDDWLAHENVLKEISEYYNEYFPWVSYGGMVVWDGGDDVKNGYPQNTPYSPQVLHQREFRKDDWRSSHTKTMLGFLWKSIIKSNFVSKQDDRYILGGDDLVIMFDAMEQCLPAANKIGRFDFTTYVYNTHPSLRQRIHDHMHERGIDYVQEIRNRSKYNTLPTITARLSGGLGNQLFQISAALSAGKKFGYLPIFDLTNHFLPLQGRKASTYQTNILRNLIFDGKIYSEHIFKSDQFHFEPIPNLPPNTILDGGFQSEKYFDKELIKETFKCPEETLNYWVEKLGNVSEYTSVHVRRGDYLKLSQHHPTLDPEYYKKAFEHIKSDKYLVFSDDIEWCKSVFTEGNFTFIKDEDYRELYLMSLCKNNIIANSTFSWWGAWLNSNENKQVIAPIKWFGPAYFHFKMDDLIPETWKRI